MEVTHPLIGWHLVHYGIRRFGPGGSSSLVDSPSGVQLVLQPAGCSPPVLVPDEPWERGGMGHFRVVRERDRLRLWYSGGGHLCYADSEDGRVWRKPNLGIREFGGSTANNIAFDKGWPCVCWFEDMDADPTQRYKALGLEASWVDKDGNDVPEESVRDAMTHRTGNEEEPHGFEIRSGMAGYTSPDRFHWKKLDAPSLMDLFSDTQAVVWHDPVARFYRGYFRTLWAGRRAVGYAETREFEKWPLPHVVFHTSAQDEPDTDVYTSCYCPYPGRPDLHLLFPAIYHHTPDTLDIHLAVSLDGLDWSRPTCDPIIPLGEVNGTPEQCLYASPDLVALPNGDWGLMYLSCLHSHNDVSVKPPENTPCWCYRWASWRPHRLVGIRASDEGRFTLKPQICHSGQLRINFKTQPGGWVRVELADREGGYPPEAIPALPGHSFDDCNPLDGDEVDATVTWKGSGDLSSRVGKNVVVRIRMSRATVFAVQL